ncbi:MAG TPA: hypothetical protein VJS92_12680, partial [Candidatus Polarisedimenticolaceae bacterium]|nr:hypothetical protein [Candidatus Polarisedimenticolaceae bacterium]
LVLDDPLARRTSAALARGAGGASPIRKAYEAGARTFDWSAEDPDGDRLRYGLELQREGSEAWWPLASDVEDEFLSWDARAVPDGIYRVRLTVEDGRDNPAEQRRSDRRVSEAFAVDNTRPEVAELRLERRAEAFELRFVARDPGGSVAAIDVAIDDEDWRPLDPDDGVADGAEERCTLRIERDPAQPPRAARVRVTDGSGNVGGALWPLD